MAVSRGKSTAEQARVIAQSHDSPEWRRWGPYLSERQWGTVREDGIAGLCDKYQHLCLALVLWNGQDPFLKERLFGLTNSEANHGEDVKELYYYLDATPSHSYLRMLYKYPQCAFPYAQLLEENRRRGRTMPEFELADSGVFDDGRYFDVFVEYAKAGPHDILMQVTAHNRGTDDAPLHLLPQLWFRNEWAWGDPEAKPEISIDDSGGIVARHAKLGTYHCYEMAVQFGDERARRACVDVGGIILHQASRNRFGMVEHDDSGEFAIPDTCYFVVRSLMSASALGRELGPAFRDQAK